jgi:hypothetical protein
MVVNWTTKLKNIASGLYFVLYTGGVISFEYTKYCIKTCIKYVPWIQDSTRYSNCLLYTDMVKNIAGLLSKKNIYYTKMFQAIAYNSEIYNDDLASFFIKYTDSVQYDESEYSNAYVNDVIAFADKNGYTLTIDNMDNDGKYVPDKTGSVSLIFYGKIVRRNGDNTHKQPDSIPIVIKYLRSNMLERIKSAVNDVGYMVSLLSLFPQLKHLYLNEILNEQKKMMLNQINFNIEVDNILKIYDNFKKTNTNIIKIPLVFPEFTNEFKNIIVMERIVGKKLEELSNDVKDEYCKILAKCLIKTVFLDGFYHCDMHPGNVLFIENENDCMSAPRFQVGILDFGIMSNISVHDQNFSFEIFKNVLLRDSNEIARGFVDNCIEPCNKKIGIPANYDKKKVCETLNQVIYEILKDKTLTCFTAKDLCALNYCILKYNMKVSKSLTNFEISLSVCDNLCKKIAFKKSYMDHLKDIVEDMFD